MNGGVRFGFGIRARMTVLFLLVTIVGVGVAGYRTLVEQTAAIRQGIYEQSTRTAEILARTFTGMMLREQLSAIHELADEALLAQSEDPVAPLLYVYVTDRKGALLHDTAGDRDRPYLSPEWHEVLSWNVLVSEDSTREIIRRLDGNLVLDVGVPCAVRGVDGRTRVYGVVRLGVGLEGLERRWAAALETTAYSMAMALLLALVIGFLATAGMIRSIQRMSTAVTGIAGGDLTERVGSYRSDELGQLARSIDRMADDLQKRELLKRYISASAWEEIEEKGLSYSEDHEVSLKEVTVLFLDIRNYTALAESNASREVVAMLNDVFTVLIEVVDEFGGVIDKFIGDALLVVFYPGQEGDDAVRAVYAGARMQEALREFNQRREFYGREAISIGVGINTGTVIAGSVGSIHRKDYTVIGDPVNVAARLQERSKEGRHTRVVLSATTYEQVSSLVQVEPLLGTEVRGRTEEINAFELVALKGLRSILDSLEDADPRVRNEAFQALEATGAPVAIPHLLKVLGGDEQGAVLKAIPILARLGSQSGAVTRLLTSMLHTTEDVRVLATAVRAVGYLEGFTDVEHLRTFLDHPDPRVRANTIEALDTLGGDDEVRVVAPLLEDPHQRVKANAAVVLFKRGYQKVVENLVALSNHEDPAERAAAVFSMGELFQSDASRPPSRDQAECVWRLREDLASYRFMAEALAARLLDEDPDVVQKAVMAVIKARESGAFEPLGALVAGDDQELAESAVAALSRIGVPARVGRLLREWRILRDPGRLNPPSRP